MSATGAFNIYRVEGHSFPADLYNTWCVLLLKFLLCTVPRDTGMLTILFLQEVQRRGALQVRAAGTVSSNDFRPGMTLEFDNAPWKVVGKCGTPQKSLVSSFFALVYFQSSD